MPIVRRYLFALLLALIGPVTPAYAQDVTEVTLKGAFLMNFARFTEWPSDGFGGEAGVSICVAGDRNVAATLKELLRGKQISGRSAAVTLVAPDAPLPTCHLLYLSGIPEQRIGEIVKPLRDTSVLTVSDSEAFIKHGGIIQIFVEGGKMKFRINTRSAKRARLALSSRLLALAEIVDEDIAWFATVPREIPPTAPGPSMASHTH